MYIYREKINLIHNSRWLIVQMKEVKSLRPLEGYREYFYEICIRNDFLNRSQKALITRKFSQIGQNLKTCLLKTPLRE